MLSAVSVGLLTLCITATGVLASRYITTETLNGHVRGVIEHVGGVDVARYLGIPYAEPPVGELRFRRPVPAKSWHPTTLDTLSFASPCAQANGSFPPSPWLVNRDQVSEDCLYLNVWSPLGRPKPLGVLFWVHGGGYRTGTASQTLYDGKTLAAVGDIVVVSINYRVGSFGFLYTGPGSSRGNYALWDQHLGLLWVRRNIARFGGDPGRVTVYGESAGSIGIGAQLVAPRNAGLIHRAIMAIGSNYWLVPPQNAVGHAYADRIAKHVGCLDDSKPSSKKNPKQVVECLRSAPVDKIIDAEETQFPSEIVPFTPSHGDDYLPLPEVDAIARGLFIPLESILTGATTEEGGVFLYVRVPSFINFTSAPELTKQEVADLLSQRYLAFLPEETRSMIIDGYLRRVPGVSDYSGNLKALMDILGDYLAFCPTRFYAEAFAKTNRPVYFYMYDYRYERDFWPSWMGSTHYADLQFTFGMPYRFPERYSDADREHSRTCMQVIGSYVNTGNPTAPGVGEWPTFTKEQPLHVFMRAVNASIGSDFHGEECDVYRKVYKALGLPVP
ncbi:acetylcholinesterase-like [Dermacentor variabilis]|uniref:acetylcholinesterase-like n=1 Tax=Dermacentor variabilis TaxID=34621 RepID=UPI003F5AEF1B